MRRAGLILIVVAAGLGAWLPSARGEGSYAAARDAYLAQDYAEAARQYEALVAGGIRNEELFYNLGNAYYRLAASEDDMLGRAILNYERALRLSPELDDARYNLAVARDAVTAKVVDRTEEAEGDPMWIRIATTFTISQLTLGFLILDVVFFAALIVLRFLASGFVRSALVVATAFVGVGAAAVGALLWAHVHFVDNIELGIVLPDETQLRDAARRPATDGALLHAGLRVHVVKREPGWVRVRLANGHEGWLPDAAVGEL